MSDSPLVSLDGLAAPVTVLIEKVAGAISGICEPSQRVRLAKADAVVSRIRAESGIEITEIEERALRRLVFEESKRQENMERILTQALSQVTDDAKPEKVDEDWFIHFFEKCRHFSDEEVQALWSRILSANVNEPGSFSKRTVSLLAELERSDAEMFLTLSRFVWHLNEPVAVILDTNEPLLRDAGLSYGDLVHLDSTGLIRFDPVQMISLVDLTQHIELIYKSRKLRVSFSAQDENRIPIGHVILSQAGKQLAAISDAEPVEGHFEATAEKWWKEGGIIEIAEFEADGVWNRLHPRTTEADSGALVR